GLRDLAAQHPLVEPLAALVIEALHEDGRDAEALSTYADVRQHLIEELGTEPGPDLRSLHRALLAGPPDTLPADTGAFTGREAPTPPPPSARSPGRSPPARPPPPRPPPARSPDGRPRSPASPRPRPAATSWSCTPSPACPGSARPPWPCTWRTGSAPTSRTRR